MANISIFQQRADELSDWVSTNKPVYPGEIVVATEEGTGEPTNLAIGKKNPANPTATTPFNELVLWYLLTQADKEKLDELVVATGENIVDLINAYLETDLATAINDAGLDYNGIATILDAGPGGAQWRELFARSIYGNPIDIDGDLTIVPGTLGISDISALQGALDLKSDDGHGHPQNQISGLDAALATKVDNSSLGVTTATLVDGVLHPDQTPPSLAAPVSSVHGRTGAIVKVAGDYLASDIPASPGGTLAGATVAAQLTELDTEKQALSGKGVANGYCDLDANVYIPTSRLRPADAAFPFSKTFVWQDAVGNSTPPAGAQELSNQTRRIEEDLSNAGTATATAYVGTTTGITGCKFKIQYAVAADSYVAWTDLCEVLTDNTAGTNIQRWGTPVAIPAGAKTATTRLRVVTIGGDGTTVMSNGNLGVKINYSVPINTGTTTAAVMSAAFDVYFGNTVWRDPAGALADASVTLAKLQNFATLTAPLRKSAGTGSLEVGTQGDWRTFIDVANTVYGRKGAVVAASGDYNADQITATATRGFINPDIVQKLTRYLTTTEFTTSSVCGFFECRAVFTGGGTTILTATINNAADVDFVFIFNTRTVNINVVPQSPRTMANNLGAALTTYAVAPGAAICASRVGNVFRILT